MERIAERSIQGYKSLHRLLESNLKPELFKILILSDRVVVGVGFNCNAMIFTSDESGLWSFTKYLHQRKAAPSSSRASQLLEAFGKLYRQVPSNDTIEPSKPCGGAHEFCITYPLLLFQSFCPGQNRLKG